MLIYAFQPILDSFECLFVCQTERNQYAVRLPVEILCDGPELLLASCIPNPHLEGMTVGLKLGLDSFHTDSFLVLLVHGFAVVHGEQGSFADSTVTQNN